MYTIFEILDNNSALFNYKNFKFHNEYIFIAYQS